MTSKVDKTGSRKSTPAGRKGRTSPTRKSSVTEAKAPPAAQAAEARSHLRAVSLEPVSPAPEAPDPVVADTKEGDGAPDLRFKRPDLLEAVSQRTAMKRSDAKVVVELVLEELGKALDRNEELVLPPLGKLMVKNRKPDADGPDILTVKIRRPRDAGETGGDSPLADPGEDG
jgi:hypothetical protein